MRDGAREIDGFDAFEDDVVGLHGIRAGKGRSSGQQFEHQDAQRPVISADVVPLVQNHFGGDVFGRSAKSPRLPASLQHTNIFSKFSSDEKTAFQLLRSTFAQQTSSHLFDYQTNSTNRKRKGAPGVFWRNQNQQV